MASKRDMRRADLIVPYMEPAIQKSDTDIQGTLVSTLPMAAIFTRNKLIGWTSVILSIQGWLSEVPGAKKDSGTPAYFSVAMSFLSLGVSYMNLFIPPQSARGGASTGTAPPAAVPSV